jgi:hypothetical protein
MHIQIINFRLAGIDEDEFVVLCDQLAPAFAALPGLQYKLWLADSVGGVYGGVYVWESEQAMQAFTRTELFAGVAGHPNFTDITSRDYGVLAGPTAVTSNLQSTTA